MDRSKLQNDFIRERRKKRPSLGRGHQMEAGAAARPRTAPRRGRRGQTQSHSITLQPECTQTARSPYSHR